MKELGKLKTRQTKIEVYDVEQDIMGTHLYAIKTITERTELIRFGNAQQMYSMLKTYWASVMWVGEDRNELNRLLAIFASQSVLTTRLEV